MNPCCGHPGCRPSSYAVSRYPHWCTVKGQLKCKAYVKNVGCVPVVNNNTK